MENGMNGGLEAWLMNIEYSAADRPSWRKEP